MLRRPADFLLPGAAHQDIGIALTEALCQKQQRSQAQAAANQQRFFGAHIKAVSQRTDDAQLVAAANVSQNMSCFTDDTIDHGDGSLSLVNSCYAEGTAQQRSSILAHLHVDELSWDSFVSDFRCINIY